MQSLRNIRSRVFSNSKKPTPFPLPEDTAKPAPLESGSLRRTKSKGKLSKQRSMPLRPTENTVPQSVPPVPDLPILQPHPRYAGNYHGKGALGGALPSPLHAGEAGGDGRTMLVNNLAFPMPPTHTPRLEPARARTISTRPNAQGGLTIETKQANRRSLQRSRSEAALLYRDVREPAPGLHSSQRLPIGAAKPAVFASAGYPCSAADLQFYPPAIQQVMHENPQDYASARQPLKPPPIPPRSERRAPAGARVRTPSGPRSRTPSGAGSRSRSRISSAPGNENVEFGYAI